MLFSELSPVEVEVSVLAVVPLIGEEVRQIPQFEHTGRWQLLKVTGRMAMVAD